ncbi:hypothetical protein HPP92_024581 [Vanilla planifolia]|uniref:Uncharacterized protein n=1 Tax=Vanilla planifolia TaxID=51239 RepID=A0A835PQ02_VANPL|nr:hypothetical protein HPP92_024581 [Vanilla planifolia]
MMMDAVKMTGSEASDGLFFYIVDVANGSAGRGRLRVVSGSCTGWVGRRGEAKPRRPCRQRHWLGGSQMREAGRSGG